MTHLDPIEEQSGELSEKLHELWVMPMSFLGFALWRAWVTLSFANPVFEVPTGAFPGKLIFDICLSLTCLLFAAFSNRIIALNARKPFLIAAGLCMICSCACQVGAATWPEAAQALWLCRTALAALGSAVVILSWCEVFSCLNPVRAAVYVSLGMGLGAVLTFILRGFTDPYLMGALFVLPPLSLLLAWRSFTLHVAPEDQPHEAGPRRVPWKFLVMLALYQAIASLCAMKLGDGYGQLIGTHSTLSTLVAATIIFVIVVFFADRIDFSLLYRSPAALLICGILCIPLLGFGGSVVAAFCVSAGSTLFGIVVMLFLCDISKRLGISALWLFGLEETLILFDHTGDLLGGALTFLGMDAMTAGTTISVAGAILIVAFTAVLLSNREVSGTWGLAFMGHDHLTPEQSRAALLTTACESLATSRNLSPRETEVLELLAQGKSISTVAGELLIAEGTAKAHIRHIYEKVGVSSRPELFEALGLPR